MKQTRSWFLKFVRGNLARSSDRYKSRFDSASIIHENNKYTIGRRHCIRTLFEIKTLFLFSYVRRRFARSIISFIYLLSLVNTDINIDIPQSKLVLGILIVDEVCVARFNGTRL